MGRYGYRAVAEPGQVIDGLVSERPDTEAAAPFFRQALPSTGCQPQVVTTDQARAYPPALAQVFPDGLPLAGNCEQQTIERDHQPLTGRIRCLRSFKTDPTAPVVCAGHGFLRHLRQGFSSLGGTLDTLAIPCPPWLMHAWNQRTTQLLAA